ncbi:MAG: SDR family oxidoreductase [Solirubrobacterales bacterium]|nr:SDR family oxidoreductase [Solirubrobacterales bacterium]
MRPAAAGGDVLLTGATGFVGMELLARYLERTERGVVALVRAADAREADARVDEVLENLFAGRARQHRGRVAAVPADLTAPGLGLPLGVRERIAARVSTIVHCAASVSFTLPLHEARSINLEGTRRVLELAELAQRRGGLDRYGHVSTAYVAGDHCGGFSERDHDVGQGFHNSYERSKFEAEHLVRRHPHLPATILRPSIVVGHRTNGWTAAFNVLYWPLRAIAQGLLTAIPAYPTSPLDVVSIDYVADAVYALCDSAGRAGRTYHLTAGPHVATIGEIAGQAARYFRRPVPEAIPPAEFAAQPAEGAEASARRAGAAYYPYLSLRAVFDSEATRAELEPRGIRASPLGEYLDRLLDFATRSRWGKRPIARANAFAA